jgi:hypothetical protein
MRTKLFTARWTRLTIVAVLSVIGVITIFALKGDKATAMLECRLSLERSRIKSGEVAAGLIELKNISTQPVEITWKAHPLENLNIIVRDQQGNEVPTIFYGTIFSPSLQIHTLRLAPGESYAHTVSVFGSVIDHVVAPGIYHASAVLPTCR